MKPLNILHYGYFFVSVVLVFSFLLAIGIGLIRAIGGDSSYVVWLVSTPTPAPLPITYTAEQVDAVDDSAWRSGYAAACLELTDYGEQACYDRAEQYQR